MITQSFPPGTHVLQCTQWIHTDRELGLYIKHMDHYFQDSGHSCHRNSRVKERLGRDEKERLGWK